MGHPDQEKSTDQILDGVLVPLRLKTISSIVILWGNDFCLGIWHQDQIKPNSSSFYALRSTVDAEEKNKDAIWSLFIKQLTLD